MRWQFLHLAFDSSLIPFTNFRIIQKTGYFMENLKSFIWLHIEKFTIAADT